MKKLSLLVSIILLITLIFSSCGNISDMMSANITELEFALLDSPVELEANSKSEYKRVHTGYFRVKSYSDFSIDDIEFVSTDKTVATFEYDSERSALKNCVNFKITALSEGETTIYAMTKDGAVKTEEITVKVTGYMYNIENVEDTSFSWEGRNVIRKSLLVKVDEKYFDALPDQSAFLKFITTEYTSEHKVNNLAIYLFDTNDDIGAGGYTIAMCNYAPYGDIAKAKDVEAGDYTNFDYKIEIRDPSVREAMRQPD